MRPSSTPTSAASAAPAVLRRAPRERFHQLDGLRAIAASLVVVHHVITASLGITLAARGHHYLANALATTTASGVELFFVLSGALLLRPYVRGERRMKAGKYFINRVRRLWPPFFVAWVVAGMVILATSRYPTWWTVGADLPPFTFSSWFAQVGIVYVGHHAYSFAWWSLSVEMLFYLLVPFIVGAIVQLGISKAAMVGMFIAAIVLAITSANTSGSEIPASLWPLVRFCTYASCFAAGVMLARFDLRDRWGWLALFIGIPYCLIAFRIPRIDVHVGWGLVYFGIVILAFSGVTRLKRWLSAWPLVWLGERSYSLFLIHYSVITGVCLAVSAFTNQKGWQYFLATRVIELPLTLLAAMLLFHFVERRFAKNLATAEQFWPAFSRPLDADPAAAPMLAIDEEALTVATS